MKDPWTRKQPAANCGHGNVPACQLDASSEDCLDVLDLKEHSLTGVCVRESYKRADIS